MTTDNIFIYAEGFCNLSVCVPKNMPIDEVTTAINEERPSGVTHPWKHSENETFSGGEPHPCSCNKNPDTHIHYLFHC